MFLTCHQRQGIVGQRVFCTGKAVECRKDAGAGAVNHARVDPSAIDFGDQFFAVLNRLRIFDIKPGNRAVGPVNAEHPIRMDKAVKAPIAAQDIGQQFMAMPAIWPVDLVIRAHHARAASIKDRLEMGEVNLAQRPRVHLDIDLEPRIFD